MVVKVECKTELEFSYDEKSIAFKQAFSDYQEVINSSGSLYDFFEHIAHNILRFGDETMVEGVGYIATAIRKKTAEPFSGITLKDCDPEFDFEVK